MKVAPNGIVDKSLLAVWFVLSLIAEDNIFIPSPLYLWIHKTRTMN